MSIGSWLNHMLKHIDTISFAHLHYKFSAEFFTTITKPEPYVYYLCSTNLCEPAKTKNNPSNNRFCTSIWLTLIVHRVNMTSTFTHE